VHEGEARRGDFVIGENLLGACLVQRQRQRERVARGVRDVQVFADRGDVRFAILAVQPFGHVEDELDARARKFLREGGVGVKSDDAAEETKSLLHRIDGGWLVPLSVDVGGLARSVRGGVGVGFLIVRETDSHVVSGDLLQKMGRSVNGP
jgi:hypothetical protein